MAICAIVRVAGFYYEGKEDDTFLFFWQHAEGAVAVMMASITAFRTLFVKPAKTAQVTTPQSPAHGLLHRIMSRFRSLAQAQPESEEKPLKPNAATSSSDGDSPFLKRLPSIPPPTFSGLRTFIRRNNRTNVTATTATTTTFFPLDSAIDPAESDYHAVLKTQKVAAASVSPASSYTWQTPSFTYYSHENASSYHAHVSSPAYSSHGNEPVHGQHPPRFAVYSINGQSC